MRNSRRINTSVNAGSMADIAFLLLIFFLVTTTISADKGILRQLPPKCPDGAICDTKLHERNVLRIYINHKQEILIEDELVVLNDIKNIAKLFIDNNGKMECDYCQGMSNINSSDHPKNAVISLQHSANTTYETFIKVQDELTKAYYELREVYAINKFGKSLENLSKKEIVKVKKAFPFILSEASTR